MSRSSSPQITSKGCSRGFILCVLYRALDYARHRQMLGHTVQFPFCNEEIKRWLLAAQLDCSTSDEIYQIGLGGTYYDEADTSTYWTQPQQFCTWWKNNVERKNKFMLLQRDAAYDESDEKQIARAAYCRNAIAISLSIKNNFHRYLPSQGDTNIVQYIIPYPMPAHMTTASFSFADCPLLTESVPTQVAVSVPQKESRVTVVAPAQTQRVKRPYNKKPPLLRLPLPHQNMLGSAPAVPLGDASFLQMTSLDTIIAYTSCASSANAKPVPNPPAAVAEEATSDSGTDDDSASKTDGLGTSEALSQNIRVGGKRKAEYCKSPTRVPATPIKPKSKSKAKKPSESLSSLSSSIQGISSSIQGTFPPYVHSYPSTSTFDPHQSFVPSCSNNTLYPIITTTPYSAVHDPLSSAPHYHSCSASLPADYHVQEYYHIEDDAAFPTTPNYPTYDDDHICYALRMPDDPFLQEMSSDYNWSGKLSQSTGFKSEYSGRVVSPQSDTDGGFFKPIKSSSTSQEGSCFYSTSNDCSDPSSFISPRSTPQSHRIPPMYPADRASLNMQKYGMENQAPLSDDDRFLMNQLTDSQPSSQTLKHPCSFRPSITPDTSSPFFSVTRIFEEDLSSLLNQHASFFHEDMGEREDKNQPRGMERNVRANFGQLNGTHTDTHTNNQHNNNNNINDINIDETHLHNNYIHPTTTTSTIYPQDHPHQTSEAVYCKNVYETRPLNAPTSAPTTPSLFTSYGNDLADYSLLDDGDDGDILSFLGYKNQKWTAGCDPESSFDSPLDGEDN